MTSSSSKPVPQLTHKLLEDNATNRFYVEYNGSFSNHVSQGIIALSALGAKELAIKAYVDNYVTRLEPSENFANDLDPEVKVSADMCELVGRRKGYSLLKEYYGKKIGDGDLASAVAAYFPGLCTGMIGAAVHGLIYMGYGFAARCRTTVIEGLAYQHYASMPLETQQDLSDPKLGRGPQPILDVLQAVKASPLHDWMLCKVQQAPWDTFNTSFQGKAAVLMTCKADDLLGFVYQIAFPESLHPDPSVSVSERAAAIGAWLVDIAITVYSIAKHKNDFFLLHGVTAAWALSQLLPCLQSHADVTKATSVYLATLVAVYIVQGCHTLSPQEMESTAGAVDQPAWESIIQRTLGDEQRDEHVYKMVQVCYEMSQQGVQRDAAKQRLYKYAALLAISNPF